MQGLNSLFNNTSQICVPDQLEDDFLKQMLANLPSSSWSLDPTPTPNSDDLSYDEHASLVSKFRNHQISGSANKASALMLHQQLLMSRAADSALLPFPAADHASSEGSLHPLYNASLHSPNQTQHFQQVGSSSSSTQRQGHSFGATNQAPTPALHQPQPQPQPQPKQRVRARRGQATDPHSIAERLRRERIAERMKALQELVPNANKTDKASMLDEIIDYVKFLQLQVKVLSMSRLGGAAAVAPLVAEMSSEGGEDCIQAKTNGGIHSQNSSNDSLSMTEQQVAKLMEEDMGSAMQYLQGKGLCLMPISLATAISTATRNPLINNNNINADGPSSPGMSVLTVQSVNGAVKDAASISKP